MRENKGDITVQSDMTSGARVLGGTAWFFGPAFRFISLAVLALMLADETPGVAQAAAPTDPGTAIATRKTNMNELEDAVDALRKELDRPAPDFAQALERARFIGTLSRRLPDGFPLGTGPESGVRTRALADIWQQPDEFRQVAAGLAARAISLEAAASQSDKPLMEERIRDIGQSCQACHSRFRGSWWPFW